MNLIVGPYPTKRNKNLLELGNFIRAQTLSIVEYLWLTNPQHECVAYTVLLNEKGSLDQLNFHYDMNVPNLPPSKKPFTCIYPVNLSTAYICR